MSETSRASPATTRTSMPLVAASPSSSAWPSGPGRAATTPTRASPLPPKASPRMRISSIGNTNTKKTLVRTRRVRRRFVAATASVFMTAPSL